MTAIFTVSPQELIRLAGEELKKQKLVSPPSWSPFVKTGRHKSRLPQEADWWYYRSAAVLRQLARLGPIGTQKLRVKYGGKKDRGHKIKHFYPASGSVIRKVLQQLETAGLIKQATKGVHKGRVLTPKGVSFLDKIARQLSRKESAGQK